MGNESRVIKMTKSRIIEYLALAPEELDLLKFVQWLELHSVGVFHVYKGGRPVNQNKFDLNLRRKK